MKKYIFIIVSLFMASFAYSQSNKEEIDLVQAAFGMDKKTAVADFVKPSEAQKDAFWKTLDRLAVGLKPQFVVGEILADLRAKPAGQPGAVNDKSRGEWGDAFAVDNAQQLVPL